MEQQLLGPSWLLINSANVSNQAGSKVHITKMLHIISDIMPEP